MSRTPAGKVGKASSSSSRCTGIGGWPGVTRPKDGAIDHRRWYLLVRPREATLPSQVYFKLGHVLVVANQCSFPSVSPTSIPQTISVPKR